MGRTIESRCYANPNFWAIPKTQASSLDTSGLFDPAIYEKQLSKYLHEYIISNLNIRRKHHHRPDYSVYTGITGIAYTFARLSLYHPTILSSGNLDAKKCIEIARECLKEAEKHYTKREHIDYSLLCGRAGILCAHSMLSRAATSAGVETSHGILPQSYIVSEYLRILEKALKSDSDEWLYGRAGYLHGLLLLRQFSDTPEIVDLDDAINKIVKRIILVGTSYAHRRKCDSPLMYQWYGQEYLGAAHGLFGILQQILLARPVLELTWSQKELTDLDKMVRGSLDYLHTEIKASGNYPSCCDEKDDHLVHFCHGAPGAVFTFLSAHRTYSTTAPDDNKYLNMAREAAGCVWMYGLLHKGPGLCHGIAGNAYCFLALQRDDPSEDSWIFRATSMASFMSTLPQNEDWLLKPDHSISLFEGLAGTALFLAELITVLRGLNGGEGVYSPLSPAFPLYELPF